ncbi:hypothetical protein BGZ58_005410, partial [Dissophora ornata]
MFSILTRRLSDIMTEHNILRGNNFSVLKGTSTQDPIHILNSIMEDAREHKKEVWCLFQDMRRCFDSVNCGPDGMMMRGLKRLKVPQEFQDLIGFITNKKTNRVITAYGMTDEYEPKCGLDQGGVECPLFWRIGYDPLLCALDRLGLGYKMSNGAEVEAEGPMVTNLAF